MIYIGARRRRKIISCIKHLFCMLRQVLIVAKVVVTLLTKKGARPANAQNVMTDKYILNEQGRIHGNPVAEGWAGAVVQKTFAI